MNLLLKADGVTHLTDARYFAALDVQHLVLDMRGESKLTIPLINAIYDWIDGPELFLQTDFPDEAGMQHWLENTNVAGFQIPLITRNVDLEKTLKCKWIFTCPVEFLESLQNDPPISILQINISAEVAKQNHLNKIQLARRSANQLFLDFEWDVDSDKMLEVTNLLKPDGLNLRGSSEEKPGFKSFDELDEILETFDL